MKMKLLVSGITTILGIGTFGIGLKIVYYALTEPLFFPFHNVGDGLIVMITGGIFFGWGICKMVKWLGGK